MPARRPPGRGSQLTAQERERACALFVAGQSVSRIAREIGCSRAAVQRAVHSPQGAEFMATAKEILRAHRQQFCRDWIEASKTAARLGSHKPARDALAAIHEIDLQPANAPTMTVQILNAAGQTVTLPGLPPATTPASALPVVPVRPALPSRD